MAELNARDLWRILTGHQSLAQIETRDVDFPIVVRNDRISTHRWVSEMGWRQTRHLYQRIGGLTS